jgi:hypothetical protein
MRLSGPHWFTADTKYFNNIEIHSQVFLFVNYTLLGVDQHDQSITFF